MWPNYCTKTQLRGPSELGASCIRGSSVRGERSLVARIADAKPWVADGTVTIVSRKQIYLRRSEVETLQRQGVRVIPWTVNKPKTIKKLMDWGVDGIITDNPDRALAILNGKVP